MSKDLSDMYYKKKTKKGFKKSLMKDIEIFLKKKKTEKRIWLQMI